MKKYEAGDVVLIRTDLYSDMEIRFGFNEEMEEFCGMFVTIKSIDDWDDDCYTISEDNGDHIWVPEMFADFDEIFDKEIMCPKCHKPYKFDVEDQVKIYLGKIVLCNSCSEGVSI